MQKTSMLLCNIMQVWKWASKYVYLICLPVCLPACLPAYFPVSLPTWLPVSRPACLFARLFFNSPAIAYIETIPSFATWSSLCTRDGMAWAGEITRVCQIPLPTKWTTDWQVPCLNDPTGGGSCAHAPHAPPIQGCSKWCSCFESVVSSAILAVSCRPWG